MNLHQAVDSLRTIRAKDPKLFSRKGAVSLHIKHPDVAVAIWSQNINNARVLTLWEEHVDQDKPPRLQGEVYSGIVTDIIFDSVGVIYCVHHEFTTTE